MQGLERIRILLNPAGSLARHFPADTGFPMEVEVQAGSTVLDLLGKYGINPDEVMVVSINGKREDKDCILKQGDHVLLLSLLGGG